MTTRAVPIGDEDLTALVAAIARRIEDGSELGVSLCVVRDGRVVLDHHAGWADRARTVPWEPGTVAPVWSLSKCMVNLAALLLVDSGSLDLDSPARRYWPELRAHGHSETTVRDMLRHAAGLPAWPPDVEVEHLYDWEEAVSRLIAQPPWWRPGSAAGYHLLSQGFLIGELIRRVAGVPPDRFIAETLTGPLASRFAFGVPGGARATEVEIAPGATADPPGSLASRVKSSPFVHLRVASDPAWRGALVPAANGFGDARDIALVQAVLSHGGEFAGRRWLSERTVSEAFTAGDRSPDLVLGIPLRWGAGFAVADPEVFPAIPDGPVCFWGGIGGAMLVNDLARRLTVCYVPNRLEFGPLPGTSAARPFGKAAGDEYLRLVYSAIGQGAVRGRATARGGREAD